ncbi:MAG: peptidylprolyl isomerase [Paracoccaceae bacterium]|nr:peptidylprolyl isomerase [Paracoccaceae bacterium]
MRIGVLIMSAWLAISALGSDLARAQGQFSPELQVGTSVVTRHQIDQRARFLTLLGAPGDTRELAREQLINQALQLDAAAREGIEVTPEAIEAGITEFAARANLTAEQFLTITGNAGITEGTIRDFFTSGVAWRETVRARFGDTARGSISQDQVRRSLAQLGTEGGQRVLVSEILLPANTPEAERASLDRAAELTRLPDETAFSAAARRFSVAPSAPRGGELNWVAFDGLPEDVQRAIGGLTPGQISQPVRLENAIGVFLLRDSERIAAGTPETLAVDYALFVVGGGAAEANAIARRVDVCDDFYGVAQGLPEERLLRETRVIRELPADIARALDTLDENETSTAITRGGNATVLMLCARQPATESTVDLEIAGNRLLNARLGTAAAHYLSQLRADTDIIDFSSN